MANEPSDSRAMWEAVERFHAYTYMAPEVRAEGAQAGLRGFWMNYFATRIAPVGAVGPAAVQSTFFYYAPARVNRAIPDAWSFSSPDAVIDARYRGMDLALRRVYPNVSAVEFGEAAELVREASNYCEPIGRVLFAGWSSLPWPKEPHLALWHGCTLLREYRSGNHLIALCAEGLNGIESVVSHVAAGGAPAEWIQDEAGWSAPEHEQAINSLRARGWLDSAGAITEVGSAGRERVEAMTDDLDAIVWHRMGQTKGRRLFDLLSELAAVLPPDDQLDWQQVYSDS